MRAGVGKPLLTPGIDLSPYRPHAVSAWLGHSENVSREHYLMITDDVWDRAVAQGAAASSRTESQELANGGNDNHMSLPEGPKKRRFRV